MRKQNRLWYARVAPLWYAAYSDMDDGVATHMRAKGLVAIEPDFGTGHWERVVMPVSACNSRVGAGRGRCAMYTREASQVRKHFNPQRE